MAFGATGVTTVISTTATSKPLALPVLAPQALISNPSTTLTVHVAFTVGTGTVAIPTADGAGATCYTVPPMSTLIVDIPRACTFWACIASGAGPTLVSLTPGKEG